MERIYDVVVIGSGPSGQTVSFRLRKTGLSVALVENELVGGEWHAFQVKHYLDRQK